MVCVEGEVRYHTHFQQKEREAKEAADNKAAAAQAERDRKALEQSNAVSFFATNDRVVVFLYESFCYHQCPREKMSSITISDEVDDVM